VQQGQIGPLVFLAFVRFAISSDDARTIIAGIAIYLIGMHYMENSFNLFIGGTPRFSARSEIDQIYSESMARTNNHIVPATA